MTKQVDRHVVITGGSRGIGLATAKTFAQAGHRVSILARDPQRLAAAVKLLAESPIQRVIGVSADVTRGEEINRAFDQLRREHGPVDYLINNAGIAESSPFRKTSIEQWNRIIAVDLTGVFLCSQAVVEEMIARRFGRIINIASTAGLKGYSYVTAYCAAKHGVVGLTRSLAQELAQHSITVNCLCPGFTETDILSSTLANAASKTGRPVEEIKSELLKTAPSGRFTTPDEVAAAALWLCADLQASINGAAIPICGGEIC